MTVQASVIALGSSVGSVFGTRLYAQTKEGAGAGGFELRNGTALQHLGLPTLLGQPFWSRVLVPGSLPFVIVCVLLLCTAMGVLAADGTHGWLITSHAGGQDSAGAASGEKRGESVAQGQGKTALGPQGKTT